MKWPNFKYERQLWHQGYKLVAGLDEVGRGSFAGPVVAATVVFAPEIRNTKYDIRINDSKKLTKLQREKASEWIRNNALAWGIGEVSAKTINRVGMTSSTQMAFRKAVASVSRNLGKKKKGGVVEYLLIDYFFAPYIRGLPMARKKARKNHYLKDGRSRQQAIKNGDERSISIAAASIIAKVYRDDLMKVIGGRTRYKKYDWVNNKGYASKKHRQAILKYGPCGYHRKQFVNSFLERRISS